MRNSFQIWINAVCEQVRFRPDHRSIEFELRDHYEEHVRDLSRLGRPRELAEERALEAMGNAQEVGRALDRVDMGGEPLPGPCPGAAAGLENLES